MSRTFLLRKVGDFYVIPKVCRRHPCTKSEKSACSSKLGQTDFSFFVRKVGDSNPRYACAYTAFRVRLFRPLRQLSLQMRCKGSAFFSHTQAEK